LPSREIGARCVPYFSFVDKVVERSKCFFERRFGVEAVEIVYVDELCLQAL